jgi:hypothetical protein
VLSWSFAYLFSSKKSLLFIPFSRVIKKRRNGIGISIVGEYHKSVTFLRVPVTNASQGVLGRGDLSLGGASSLIKTQDEIGGGMVTIFLMMV